MNREKLPRFDELPLSAGDPPYSAWGLWKDSSLGSLNHLTADRVLQAARNQIITGTRVCLNLPLNAINPGLLGRPSFEQKLINKEPHVINDDSISFNTQCSSQWDSFRHFAYQKEKMFYNGITQDVIHGLDKPGVNGIGEWAEQAIAGRGVLIDFYDWAQTNAYEFDPLATSPVTVEQIKRITAEKNIELLTGDILFIRTGYVSAYRQLSADQRKDISTKFAFPGLAQSEETTRWLWDRQFAAVAADSPAFECTPPTDPEYFLHPVLLAGWGTPIGELFDLERLSEACVKLNRWTFFLCSVPLNYSGAVASPPNAMAVF
ncbi:uncharacterized protein Z519_09221 [Cladophialophora bantiana CBS 173.52]|uniref:Cyclase n=1 Tax=Cladophialophora bantiana (strain ATCC 10958 / CBS 173.52 / CDC B-1940 / NIH 8579) TaxID=1442370 RepID=A0A0D2I144_CLAB1|nr:uncharacterized protein Z519_09221 [Cladophialophora bantiana CBS 173.52]KIW90574.1 hypothetical protein Z519_09221 [Cladophialophora bantiana CBS 173.52]